MWEMCFCDFTLLYVAQWDAEAWKKESINDFLLYVVLFLYRSLCIERLELNKNVASPVGTESNKSESINVYGSEKML